MKMILIQEAQKWESESNKNRNKNEKKMYKNVLQNQMKMNYN